MGLSSTTRMGRLRFVLGGLALPLPSLFWVAMVPSSYAVSPGFGSSTKNVAP